MATTSLPLGLVDAIRDASFPESEEVLSSSINQINTPPLLGALDAARNELSETVRIVSRQEAGDVDGWIEQAKRVQADIARCKEDARHIIQEHERVEALRSARDQARNKTLLLQAEIVFNETLEKQISLISETSAALSKVDNAVGQQQLLTAAQALPGIVRTIHKIPGNQSRALLMRMHFDLEQRLSKQLQQNLDEHVLVSTSQSGLSLQILQEMLEKHDSSYTDASPSDVGTSSLHHSLEAMNLLGLKDHATSQITQRVDAALLPHLYGRSKLKISNVSRRDSGLLIGLSSDAPAAVLVASACFEIVKYLHDFCPDPFRQDMMQKMLSKILPILVTEWLDLAIPMELDRLTEMNELRAFVETFDDWLKEHGYGESKELQLWVKEIPRTWLSKRRTLALDIVRTAFKKASGSTSLVERIERQTLNATQSQLGAADDDWADNWDDDEDQRDPVLGDKVEEKSDGGDGSDAWGFDTDEQSNDASLPSTEAGSGATVQEDEAEAWGWGDEDEPNAKSAPAKMLSSTKPNGLQPSEPEQKDIVLKESYSVTDIPEYVIEHIGIDLTDNYRLRESPSTYFKSTVTPLPDLGSLPTLTLAMFRAIAASSYQTNFSPPLTNMHLYNDVLYLASRMAENSGASTATPSRSPNSLLSQKPVLEKFARQIYTSEISTHRTILLDLLDTAQGFVSCTRSPYAETCETAITSTTEYLRSVHSQWSPILSSSHLLQSIGNLLSSMMRKIIEDIEDMEDISEPESRKLLSLCEPVSALQDLFIVHKPTDQPVGVLNQEEEGVSTIAVHCASYLRFQYLQQILESNLVEIKYLWTDAGLSLEFRPEEVVDLIQALFTESPQRRSAINTIKSSS